MRKRITGLKMKILMLGLLISAASLQAQISDVGNMITGAKTDGEALFKAYLTPYANALGADLSGGWYNTAKPHKLGGFDITLTFNMALVPSQDKTFDLNNIENFSGDYDHNNSLAPTVAGSKEVGPQITYSEQGVDLASFNTPKGTGVGFIPTPMVQLGVGLIKGTEVIGRFMPTVDVANSGSSVGLWGIGLKHSLKQWIPAINRIPVLHLSVMGGYTKLTTNSELSVMPGDIGLPSSASDATTFNNQAMGLEVSSFTMNLLVSANLPVISFYGGVGISSTKMSLALTGNYPMGTVTNGQADVTVTTDPFNMTIKNTDGSTTNPRLNAGLRLKLGVITIHGDYTYANYSVVTAGLGVSLR
ncbi:MAG TPA: DUF6588 family protein [Bacteroidales bacterium]|nr:DUF6588 family protein [Bacteroidales bacterium]